MNKVLEYIIRAKDATAAGASSAMARVKALAGDMVKNLANIHAGFQLVGAAITGIAGKVWRAVKEAFKFESLTIQFSVLMGSIDKAKERMAELADFAASTPFSMEEAVNASRQLHVFSNGALGATESLKLVGDAAAAVGQPMKEVAFWVGRAYSMIKGGQPFGEAAMRLQEMGIITPEIRSKMEELQEAGASNIEVWEVLEERLGAFKGGMEQLSKTGDGLTSTLKDNWTAAVRSFGEAFTDITKTGLKALSDKLDKLAKDGTIAVWANRSKDALQTLGESLGWAGKAIKGLYNYSGISDAVSVVKGYSRAAGALSGGGGFKGMLEGYYSGRAEGFYGGKIQKALGDPFGGVAYNERRAEAAARKEAAIRAEAAAKAAKDEKAAGDMKNDIAKDMANSQKIIDEKRAKEAAEKEAKERDKQLKKEAEARKKALLEVAKAEHEQRIKNARAEVDISEAAENAARDRLSRAQAAAKQAWGWYRDPAAFKAQLAEEKANKEAEKQFSKDSDRLRRASNWRTRELDADQEAVRRVIFAREEERAASLALINIERNTADLAKKLDELLALK